MLYKKLDFGIIQMHKDVVFQCVIARIHADKKRLNSRGREDIILKPLRTIGAVTASGVGGDSYSTSFISIARIRSKVSQVLDNMSESINKNLMYRRMMKDTLWKENADDEEQISILVAYLVSDGLNSPQKDDKYYVSKNNSTEQIISMVK